jgi:hypothetical protein
VVALAEEVDVLDARVPKGLSERVRVETFANPGDQRRSVKIHVNLPVGHGLHGGSLLGRFLIP